MTCSLPQASLRPWHKYDMRLRPHGLLFVSSRRPSSLIYFIGSSQKRISKRQHRLKSLLQSSDHKTMWHNQRRTFSSEQGRAYRRQVYFPGIPSGEPRSVDSKSPERDRERVMFCILHFCSLLQPPEIRMPHERTLFMTSVPNVSSYTQSLRRGPGSHHAQPKTHA